MFIELYCLCLGDLGHLAELLFFFSFLFPAICRSNAKSHPQDVLLKLRNENMYKQEAVESSRFVHKLGLYKLQCCLLMNGLVHESNEV